MRHDFGVGLGGKLVSFGLQLVFQLNIILNDSVVDDDNLSGAVAMRVGVFFRGAAMRGPARVSDAIQAVKRGLGDGLFEVAQLSRGAPNLHFAVLLDDGNAGRIVAAILEPPQTVQNQRHDFLRSDIPDDPAHVSLTPASNFKELAKGNPSATNLD